MRRFFVDPQAIIDGIAHLSPAESLHIAAVLRLQPGDEIELFDGTGTVYQGTLLKLSREQVSVRLVAAHREEEKAPSLFLLQSLMKGKKMDFLVQKATELGVHTFQPVETRYSENRGNPERQQERWQRIMLESCKQCKRPMPMVISPLTDLKHIELPSGAAKIILWENEQQQPLAPILFAEKESVCLYIGPEGGFHRDEIKIALEYGFQTITLGSRTLRAETAALATVAIIQYLLGMLGNTDSAR
ncbi:MAG: 16S rRNA (uracil(1498)-N(3))-methyltransferase [Desulfobulbaceae bacterium]|nr:16S rRNA (uracil(1498)-N(3))-methyltransferase [Desulfobulbaceae bacterium]